jgi:hypothetical protein
MLEDFLEKTKTVLVLGTCSSIDGELHIPVASRECSWSAADKFTFDDEIGDIFT